MLISRLFGIRLMKEENDDVTPYLVSSTAGRCAVD